MKYLNTLLSLFIVIIFSSSSFAQFSVTPNNSANDLADALTGDGITIINATLTCPTDGAGTFSGAIDLGVDEGIILTSGLAINALGPNDEDGVTGSFGGSGDSDLENLIGGVSTCDACILEIEFTTNEDEFTFEYQFASDEYNEFFCSSFNDPFGFFLSGPNPAGGNYNTANIALVPGTSDPVSINNVGPQDCDGVDNSGFYTSNDFNDGVVTNETQYDGFTDVFMASANIVPGETYTLKLAIADAGDCALDSGVILKGDSFTAGPPPPPTEDIPTMSEWGLFIFALTILTLMVVTVYNLKRRGIFKA